MILGDHLADLEDQVHVPGSERSAVRPTKGHGQPVEMLLIGAPLLESCDEPGS